MGEIIQFVIKGLEELGLTPITIFVLILLVLLFTWLYKQVAARKEKLHEEEKAETLALLNQYSLLYKTLLLYHEGKESRETLLDDYTNSIPLIKKEICDKLEGVLYKGDNAKESICEIKKEINVLKQVLDEISPIFNRGTFSGSISFTIRIIELIFQPIFITTCAFLSIIYFTFVGLQPLFGLNALFFSHISIVMNLFLILAIIAAIVDKRFNYSPKNVLVICTYFFIVVALLIVNQLLTSISACILFFVFASICNPKKEQGVFFNV